MDQGYADNDITYDKGTVKLKGKSFTTPTVSGGGRTYDTAENLSKALANYRTNDYGNQVDNTLSKINTQVNADPYQFKAYQPFSYTPESDPQYQAALRTAQSNAKTAGNNAAVAFGARGIGNSSATTDRIAQIQQQEYGKVTDNVLPQLMAQAYQQYADAANRDFQLQSANYGVGQDRIGNQSNYAGLLSGLQQQGLDNQYRNDQQSYQVGRDKVADQQWAMQFNNANKQWKATFDEDNRRYGQDYALRKLAQDHNITMDKAQLLISQQNADTSRMGANLNQDQFNWSKDYNNPDNVYRRDQMQNNKYDQLYKSWQTTGQAPAGLEELGVKMGQKWRDLTPTDAISQLSKSRFISTGVDQTTGAQTYSVNDPQGLAAAILSMPLSDSDFDQIARYFGVDLDAMQRQAMGN